MIIIGEFIVCGGSGKLALICCCTSMGFVLTSFFLGVTSLFTLLEGRYSFTELEAVFTEDGMSIAVWGGEVLSVTVVSKVMSNNE